MSSLQSQDIVLAIYLSTNDEPWTFQSVGKTLGISQSQVHLAWRRLVDSKLADSKFRRPIKRNLLEFLCHGAKYSFPVKRNENASGMVTGYTHPILNKLIKGTTDVKYVWNNTQARSKGVCIDPIHKSAPSLAKENERAYEILATLDAIRLGNAREQEVAMKLMKELLLD